MGSGLCYIPIECMDNTGGIKNVYIAAFNEDNTYTYDTDESILTVTSAETFYTFKFRPQTSSYSEEGTHSVENGTNFWTQTLAMIFHKMDADKRNKMLLLAQTSMSVVVEDQNGTYWFVGLVNGANTTASTNSAGQAYGDLNGYNITITGQEPLSAHELSAAGFATLTIAA